VRPGFHGSVQAPAPLHPARCPAAALHTPASCVPLSAATAHPQTPPRWSPLQMEKLAGDVSALQRKAEAAEELAEAMRQETEKAQVGARRPALELPPWPCAPAPLALRPCPQAQLPRAASIPPPGCRSLFGCRACVLALPALLQPPAACSRTCRPSWSSPWLTRQPWRRSCSNSRASWHRWWPSGRHCVRARQRCGLAGSTQPAAGLCVRVNRCLMSSTSLTRATPQTLQCLGPRPRCLAPLPPSCQSRPPAVPPKLADLQPSPPTFPARAARSPGPSASMPGALAASCTHKPRRAHNCPLRGLPMQMEQLIGDMSALQRKAEAAEGLAEALQEEKERAQVGARRPALVQRHNVVSPCPQVHPTPRTGGSIPVQWLCRARPAAKAGACRS